jgi:hypothetical protein
MDYIRLEVLTDCICRKCSMRATLHKLEQDVERLAAVTSKSSVSQSKKKRVREVKRFSTRLKAALDEGRIEEDIKGVKMEKVFSRASTKQAMVARVSHPPLFCSTLCLTYVASARTCIASQSLCPFWRIRLQKHRTRAFPRTTRLDTVHDLRHALHFALIPHLFTHTPNFYHHLRRSLAGRPAIQDQNTYTHTHTHATRTARALPSRGGGMPLRAALVRTLCLLPAQTAGRRARRAATAGRGADAGAGLAARER